MSIQAPAAFPDLQVHVDKHQVDPGPFRDLDLPGADGIVVVGLRISGWRERSLLAGQDAAAAYIFFA